MVDAFDHRTDHPPAQPSLSGAHQRPQRCRQAHPAYPGGQRNQAAGHANDGDRRDQRRAS